MLCVGGREEELVMSDFVGVLLGGHLTSLGLENLLGR